MSKLVAVGLVVTTFLTGELIASDALTSIDTGLTICKVRLAVNQGIPYIVASSYEGTVLGVSYQGKILWKNALSGFMNRDLWCADITGDGADEIFAANADGSVYCLSGTGKTLWTFRMNDAPMNAVCIVHAGQKPYVACGSFDTTIYFLDGHGKLVKTLACAAYSKEQPWGKSDRRLPPANKHVANFLRPVRRADGTTALAVHGVIYGNSASGHLYLFEPLAEKPYKVIKAKGGVGELRAADVDGDGNDEILTGATSMIQDAHVSRIDVNDERQAMFDIAALRNKIDGFGYRVAQPELIRNGNSSQLLVLFGSKILLLPMDLRVDPKQVEVLDGQYSYNDMWKVEGKSLIVLASAQSGGSCVHVLNLDNPGWKAAYANLQPPGKIAAILANTAAVRERVARFQAPPWERKPPVVHIAVGRKLSDPMSRLKTELESKYPSPVFLCDLWEAKKENWDRSALASEHYRNRRDGRMKYEASQKEILDQMLPVYRDYPGVSYWGGHGNDPFFYSMDTRKKLLDGAQGKYTAVVFPEFEDGSKEFHFVMDELVYPFASYCRGRNASIYVRTKNVFWLGTVYEPFWDRLASGEFADIFVPLMEDTTGKSQDLSVAGLLGIWASGATDKLGARCAWDNPSYDRLRQFSHQRLPSHFLCNMVYWLASGVTEINAAHTDYTSLYWELIAKGALYIPKRQEIVSFSPVHLGMKRPDERFLDDGSNVKWTTFYNEKQEAANPMVFSRLNGSWPGAPVTQWDFSRYAASVKERRLSFLPPYENGLVLITPPQTGVFATPKAPRGKLTDHLHPLYRNIIKEYITDGRNYYSADGKQTYKADEYYKVIEADIKAGAEKLPLTVSGNVAWVCAQTARTHLRLTLIDSGYINPGDKTAVITFHTVRPVVLTDLLTNERIKIENGNTARVPVPCGLFRFLDVEMENVL